MNGDRSGAVNIKFIYEIWSRYFVPVFLLVFHFNSPHCVPFSMTIALKAPFWNVILVCMCIGILSVVLVLWHSMSIQQNITHECLSNWTWKRIHKDMGSVYTWHSIFFISFYFLFWQKAKWNCHICTAQTVVSMKAKPKRICVCAVFRWHTKQEDFQCSNVA